MNFQIRLDGSPEAKAKLAALSARLSDMSPLLQRLSVMELAQAQGRIEAGGPGWDPTWEQSKGTPLNRNGALLRSLTRGGAGNVWEDIANGLAIGTGLTTDDGYNIGRLMQGGTGIYGPSNSPIKPTRAKALSFVVNGKRVFRRSVKGSPPRPFLYVSSSDRDRALQIAMAYVKGKGTTP